MSRGYLPDTNILSTLFEGSQLLRQRLSEVDVYISTVVLGELFYGAFNAPERPRAKALQNAQHFARSATLLRSDAVTSERYGLMCAYLEKHGLPIQMNDVWIAAQADQYGLTIVTRDLDFDHIPGLSIVKW